MPRRRADDLHDLLLELVRSIGTLHVAGAASEAEFSLSEALALHELDTGDGLVQQDLADRLRLDKSTVSRLVAQLEDRGLLTRQRDPDNRRLVRLSLTATGRRMHRRLGRSLHDRQNTVLAAMTASEQAALRTGLVGLLRALHHDDSVDR